MVTFNPYGEIHVGELHKLLPELNRTPGYFRHRWAALGEPKEVTREMFTPAPKESEANKTRKTQWKDLSSDSNTGAGKGDIPDEVWFRMRHTRNSMAEAKVLRYERGA